MKKSNILLTVALLVIIASIAFSDAQLVKAYQSGAYKRLYNNYKSLAFKDFDVLDINSETQANIKITQGPFSVRISSASAQEYTTVTQHGNHLQIDVNEAMRTYDNNDYVLLISCPKLRQVNTNARYMVEKKVVIDSVANEDRYWRKTTIQGFNEDSLKIQQDYGSFIVMINNTINNFNANLGTSTKSGSFINISKNNHFKQARVNLMNQSTMIINNALVNSVNYTVADSSRVIIVGAIKK